MQCRIQTSGGESWFRQSWQNGAVQVTDAASTVGDEPLLIVQRTGVALFVNRQRNKRLKLCVNNTLNAM